MQYNKYKTILEQVSHPQEAIVNARNETTKSTTTLDYYNKNAKKFISGTISVDFGIVQNRFLDKLHPGAEILDYGCGSGRDTKYFLEQGYKVTAIDGSQELCKLASEYTGIPVKHISNIERDVTAPDIEQLKKFADIYNISLDQLVGREFFGGDADNVERRIIDYVKQMDKEGKELSLG